MMTVPSPAQVLDFWRSAGQENWFNGDADFDAQIRDRFADLHRDAAAGLHDDWAATAEGALALVIVLDQFSRNLYRGSPVAFATDDKALAIAAQALARGDDLRTEPALRVFFYMPFEHSESLADQDRSVALCHALHGGESLEYALIHRSVIRRFGRFPHRNEALGRKTSPAEKAFLDGGGLSAGTYPAPDEPGQGGDSS